MRHQDFGPALSTPQFLERVAKLLGQVGPRRHGPAPVAGGVLAQLVGGGDPGGRAAPLRPTTPSGVAHRAAGERRG